MKKLLIVLLVLLVIGLAVGLIWAGNYFFDIAFVRAESKDFLRGNDNLAAEQPEARQANYNDNAAWLEAQRYQTLEIESDDGLKLVGTYIYAHVQNGRTAIVVHGYSANRQSMLGFARIFVEELGYNVLLPDLRAHGDSEGEIIGFGWPDRLDMLGWIDRALQEHSREEQIVLYGISMGGATVMMTAGEELPGNVKAIIEDCGYSSVKGELSYQLKELFGLPSFPLINAASLVARYRAGFFLGDASAVKQLEKCTLPILFIHGEADTFVPYSMLDEVYQAAAGPKERYTVAGAAHGQAYSMDPDQYVETLRTFLETYVD